MGRNTKEGEPTRAFPLLLLPDPHAHHEAEQEEDHRGGGGGVENAEGGAGQVLHQQHPVAAVDQPVPGVEEAAEDGACEATDAVEAEAVQGVVHQAQPLQATCRGDAAEGAHGPNLSVGEGGLGSNGSSAALPRRVWGSGLEGQKDLRVYGFEGSRV